jgi:hypothetical protein
MPADGELAHDTIVPGPRSLAPPPWLGSWVGAARLRGIIDPAQDDPHVGGRHGRIAIRSLDSDAVGRYQPADARWCGQRDPRRPPRLGGAHGSKEEEAEEKAEKEDELPEGSAPVRPGLLHLGRDLQGGTVRPPLQ